MCTECMRRARAAVHALTRLDPPARASRRAGAGAVAGGVAGSLRVLTTIMKPEGRLKTVSSHLQPTRRMKPHTERAFSSGRKFNDAEIGGSVRNGWEKVRIAFAENFAQRDELGASCCVTYKGEVVVDLCTHRARAYPCLRLSVVERGQERSDLTQRRCVVMAGQGVE